MHSSGLSNTKLKRAVRARWLHSGPVDALTVLADYHGARAKSSGGRPVAVVEQLEASSGSKSEANLLAKPAPKRVMLPKERTALEALEAANATFDAEQAVAKTALEANFAVARAQLTAACEATKAQMVAKHATVNAQDAAVHAGATKPRSASEERLVANARVAYDRYRTQIIAGYDAINAHMKAGYDASTAQAASLQLTADYDAACHARQERVAKVLDDMDAQWAARRLGHCRILGPLNLLSAQRKELKRIEEERKCTEEREDNCSK